MDSVTIRSMVRESRALSAFGAAMAALAVVCLAGLVLDPRLLGGQPIWAKPLKFSVSFVLYAATLVWMISLVSTPRTRRWARRGGAVVATAGAIEMIAIVGQVLRGRASHFNIATPLDTAVWAVMGTTIVVLWVATAGIGVLLLRERTLAADTAWAVRLGLVVTLAGMAVAFLMTSPTGAQIAAAQETGRMTTAGAHAVGVPDGGAGLPLVGWSTTGGDLRIAHFVGLHALQGLPLLALALLLLAARRPGLRDVAVRARLVGVAGAAWAGLTALLTWQALRGQSIIAPDAPTLAAAAVLVAATVAGTLLVLRGGTRRRATTDRVLEPQS
ncbi:hypothetical protein [Actinomycetospora straminea]|uniref:Cytochrome c oxidase assembly protein subunit 15 n=1 Tax=Actinomycetospora straminea TaxID=663607 RepID=A0ABP9EKV0_9PSEU|nr:hypothetical protein [Actinomycetospora straminea]MDD7935083.1 hypothetical protein [Actinomycetospora straminea]